MKNTKVTLWRMIKIYFQCKHCRYNAGCTAKYSPYRRIPRATGEYVFWYSKCFIEMEKHQKEKVKKGRRM